jgi:phosphoribosylanthranilate isomerase
MLLIKVCGITRVEDAQAAVALGASALGFVFWPESPRSLDPYRARAIVASLPVGVTPVGVFVDQPVEYVNAVASLVGLGAVQLHGGESPDEARHIRRPLLKAFTLDAIESGAATAWAPPAMVLLDAHDPVRRGGTGQTIDWTRAAAAARRRPTLLAGGLTAGNVAEAIARVRPFGIDVSSGVEERPGIKDAEKLRAFFAAVRSASEGVA